MGLTLGLDISSNITGWSKFDSTNLIDYGSINIHKYKSSDLFDNNMLYKFGIDIKNILLEFKPDVVAIENIYIGINKSVPIKLAMMSGIVRYLSISICNSKILTIYPVEVNNILKIPRVKSNKRKSMLVEMINKKFNITLSKKNHDIADAIGLALVSLNKVKK